MKITDLSLNYVAKACPSLKQFDLSRVENITDAGLQYLFEGSKMKELIHLGLYGCKQITDAGLNFILNRFF
jgi:hypothetical protein